MPDEMAKLKAEVRKALKIPFAERNKKQKRMVYAAFRADDPEFNSRNKKLSKLEKKEPKPVTTLVMAELKDPRETFVLVKGDFTRPGERVRPGVPAVLLGTTREPSNSASVEAEHGSTLGRSNAPTLHATSPNRLDLARWIVDPANPLSARVAINRLWQQYFGRGLVETENDFGAQGSPPTHLELLDWLACEFMEGGKVQSPKSQVQSRTSRSFRPGTLEVGLWTLDSPPFSLKHMHRLIVTSATYRQSSRLRPDLANIDANNKLLARQSRLRLDAEIVRDVCLSASGLLNRKIGGPSIFPPQPDGVMNLGQSRREWKASQGPDRYRRGMYTFFWRATPHPALMVFDSSDAFSTCTRRLRSNTPLQALTLLNDEAFYECAQGLAHRVLSENLRSDGERIDYAFRLCLARGPSAAERQRLNEILALELQRDGKANAFEPWTTVARVLLNLDETITRE